MKETLNGSDNCKGNFMISGAEKARVGLKWTTDRAVEALCLTITLFWVKGGTRIGEWIFWGVTVLLGCKWEQSENTGTLSAYNSREISTVRTTDWINTNKRMWIGKFIRFLSGGSICTFLYIKERPKYWTFSFSISPSNEHPGLISSEWTGWISLQSQGLSRVFSNTTVKKHQFFSAQLSSPSNSHIHTWPLEKPQPWLDRPLLAK